MPSGLSLNILIVSKLIRNSKPAARDYYEILFKLSITVYMLHLIRERQI